MDDRLTRTVAGDPAHQFHVEFDQIGPEIGEQIEFGIAGAEVVDRHFHTVAAKLVDDGGKALMVIDHRSLGDFEHNLVEADAHSPCGRESGANDSGRGHQAARLEVQVQAAIQTALGRQCNGLRPTALIDVFNGIGVEILKMMVGGSLREPRSSASYAGAVLVEVSMIGWIA